MSLQVIYFPYYTRFTQARSLMGLWSCLKIYYHRFIAFHCQPFVCRQT